MYPCAWRPRLAGGTGAKHNVMHTSLRQWPALTLARTRAAGLTRPRSGFNSASALAARDMALAAASSACRSCTRDCSILLWATSMSVLFCSSAARRRRFSRSRPSKSSCVTRRAPRGAFSLRAHVSRRGLLYYKGALECACPCGAGGEGHAVAPHGSTPPPARASAGPLATRPAAWPRGTVLGSSCGRAALL